MTSSFHHVSTAVAPASGWTVSPALGRKEWQWEAYYGPERLAGYAPTERAAQRAADDALQMLRRPA